MPQHHDTPPRASLSVRVKDNENINSALRRFKRKVSEAGVIQEARERQFYEQPSQTRKKDRAAGKARARKKLSIQSLPKKY
jgi:small subunit ribosomal protein S21